MLVHLAHERPDLPVGKLIDAVAEEHLVFGQGGQGAPDQIDVPACHGRNVITRGFAWRTAWEGEPFSLASGVAPPSNTGGIATPPRKPRAAGAPVLSLRALPAGRGPGAGPPTRLPRWGPRGASLVLVRRQ